MVAATGGQKSNETPRMTATPTGLGRSTTVMAVGTTLSRATGFARVFALAYALGFTRFTDAYSLANTTPNIVYELVLGGVLSATLLPIFVERLEWTDRDRAKRDLSAITSMALLCGIVLSLALALLARPIVELYTMGNNDVDAELQRDVATDLLRMFAPQVVLYLVVTLTTALLNARRKFAAPMFTPILNNLVVIGVLLSIPHIVDDPSLSGIANDQSALRLLGWGTTAGVALMALAMVVAARRAGFSLRPRFEPRNPAVIEVLKLSGWTFGFVLANQLALFVVLTLAARDAGGVAAYQSAYIFFLLPYGIVAVSIMSALAPEWASRWNNRNTSGLVTLVQRGIRQVSFVMLPAAVGLALVAYPLVSSILEYGALSSESADDAAAVLTAMAIGLPGFSLFLLTVRALQSMRDTRTIFVLYAIENVINVVAAIALRDLGVAGLGAAFAIAYSIAAVLGLVVLHRKIGGLVTTDLLLGLGRMVVAAGALGVAVALALLATTDTGDVLRIVVAIPVGAVTYALASRLLRLPELTAMIPRKASTVGDT